MQHGENIILALAMGTQKQRDMLQDALNRWWESLLFFFGPPQVTDAARRMLEYRIRVKTNEELRQQFLDKYIPQIRAIGLKVPDPELHYDERKQRWVYTPPDWEKFSRIVRKNCGPKSQERIQLRRQAHEGQRWVREAMLRSAQASAAV